MIVLALDLATVSGFAVADSETYQRKTALECAVKKVPQPHSGDKLIARGRVSHGQFQTQYQDWLLDMIGVHQPECIAYEAPFVGEKTNQDNARKLFGLAAVTELTAYRVSIVKRCFEVDNMDVRKHFIRRSNGKRKELKELTIIECEGRGWKVKDDNEADALALLDYAMHCLVPNGAA